MGLFFLGISLDFCHQCLRIGAGYIICDQVIKNEQMPESFSSKEHKSLSQGYGNGLISLGKGEFE
ncbi:hypothetical protein MKX03_015639, partial [Papaver bracteatum]